MTTVTVPATDYGTDCEDADAPGVCWERGGPCLTYKSSVHGWRCTVCIDRCLDDGAARWAARSEKAKERVSRNLSHDNNIRTPVATDRPRDGGGLSYVPHRLPASAEQEEAADPRYVPRRVMTN